MEQQNNTPPTKVPTLAETAPPNIPRPPGSPGGPNPPVTLGGAAPTPPMDQFTCGKFRRKSDGEEYALAIVPDNSLNSRTHRLMNTSHYWEGTETQFIEAFTDLDGRTIEKKEPTTEEKKEENKAPSPSKEKEDHVHHSHKRK